MVYVFLADLKKYKPRGIKSEVSNAAYNEICFKQKMIIEFVQKNIKNNGIQYKLIYCKPNMDDKDFQCTNDDVVLWHPNVAGNNLDFVKSCKYSIVILQSKTVLIQRPSPKNPITENMAVNHGFYVMYVDSADIDITNKEWNMVVTDDYYTLSIERLLTILNNKK